MLHKYIPKTIRIRADVMRTKSHAYSKLMNNIIAKKSVIEILKTQELKIFHVYVN